MPNIEGFLTLSISSEIIGFKEPTMGEKKSIKNNTEYNALIKFDYVLKSCTMDGLNRLILLSSNHARLFNDKQNTFTKSIKMSYVKGKEHA